MSDSASHYVHGTEPGEQRRLSLLNDILNQRSLRELSLRVGEHVLDLGCGLGQLTRLMARAAGSSGQVVGIERSGEQLAQARRLAVEAGEDGQVEFRQGDVLSLSLPPNEWGSFDVAHARFVLEHVPHPLDVVRAMVRAVKPGGRIVIEDDDHDVMRLWPEPPGFERAWRAYVASYTCNGNDPYVGRRLVALLHEAGTTPRRSTAIWFGGSAGEPSFPAWVENLCGVLAGARAAILGGGEMNAAALDATLDAVREWGRRPDAASWYFVAYAEGVR